MTCNLLLVDDHPLIRAGVRALVMDIPGYCVIGEAEDGAQAVEMVQILNPDIVVLDLSMKQVGGLEALATLKAQRPLCKVLILSMHTDPAMIMRALESGAHGYLLKDTTATELEHALARGATIYAEVVGYGATSDGYDMVAPSGEGARHGRSDPPNRIGRQVIVQSIE